MSDPEPLAGAYTFRQSRPALIRSAAEIVATHPGGADRILARHIADEHGRCAACSREGVIWWPCAPVNIALLARLIASCAH